MNTQNTHTKTLTLKQGLVATMLPMIVFIGGLWLSGSAGASEDYTPLVPVAQQSYDKALAAFQAAENNLVQAKIMDNAHGALELTPEQIKRLQEKKLGF